MAQDSASGMTKGRSRRAYPRRAPNTPADALSLARIPLHQKNWIAVLNALLGAFNHQHASKQKDVSFGTQEERRNALFRCFRELREIGYNLDPRSLGERHIQALVNRWLARGLSAGTIHDYLSFLRALGVWIGKPGLVHKAPYYVGDPDRVQRSGVAVQDKSWLGHGVDVHQVIVELAGTNKHASVQLELICAFGLRVKECLMLRPHLALVPAAATGLARPTAEWYLRITRGSKGGRARNVPVDSAEEWRALEHAKQLVRAPDDHLGDPGLSLKAAMHRFYDVMKRHGITQAQLGITAHGLRHQYAQGRYWACSGVEAPVRGGPVIEPARDTAARLAVAQELGHARKQISGAHLGAILPSSNTLRAGGRTNELKEKTRTCVEAGSPLECRKQTVHRLGPHRKPSLSTAIGIVASGVKPDFEVLRIHRTNSPKSAYDAVLDLERVGAQEHRRLL